MALAEISEVERFVRERFNVKDVYYKGSGAAEFSIGEGDSYKEKFEDLVRFLRPKGLFPMLRSTDGGLVLYVESTSGLPRRQVYLPIILFFATVATVVGDGWLRASGFHGLQRTPVGGSWIITAAKGDRVRTSSTR